MATYYKWRKSTVERSKGFTTIPSGTTVSSISAGGSVSGASANGITITQSGALQLNPLPNGSEYVDSYEFTFKYYNSGYTAQYQNYVQIEGKFYYSPNNIQLYQEKGSNYIKIRPASGSLVQEVYVVSRAGTFQGYVYSTNPSAYPTDGVSGDYYYDQRTTVTSPTNPSSITFGNPKSGEVLSITAGAATDVVGAGTLTYVFERQIDNGAWTQVSASYSRTVTNGVPGSGEYINYRVKARDTNGAESAYTTGVKKLIEYPIKITNPGKPEYKYPISGKEMKVKWNPSATPDASPVTYVLEKQINAESWEEVDRITENSYTLTVPEVSVTGTLLTLRVKGVATDGNESEYVSGDPVEILYHKVIRFIPWKFGTPFKARQFTKNAKNQYQTVLEGALAKYTPVGYTSKLCDMPLETVIRFGKIYNEPILWKLADKNHEGYPENSVSFVNVYGLRGICFDAKESSNPKEYATKNGNADYRISNAHLWLNSDKPAEQWYTAQHEYDAPPDENNVFFTSGMAVNPYYNFPGFLYEFTQEEKNALMETDFLVVVPKEGDTTEVVSIRSKIALISRWELNGTDGVSLKDGSPFPIFTDDLSRQLYLTQTCVDNSNYMYNNSTSKPNDYWMRGCMAGVDADPTGYKGFYFGFKCNNKGSLSTKSNSSNGNKNYPSNLSCHVTAMPFRCVLNLSSETLVDLNPNEDGSYNIVWEE